MTIWADADSLPAPARELIARVPRRGIHRAAPVGEGSKSPNALPPLCVVFVANRRIPTPDGVEFRIAETGKPDAADDLILASAAPGDLVVTRDIPFAARLVEAGIAVINDRGDEWTPDTIRERLSQRNFMADLRAEGLADSPRSGRYGPRERKAFADALDRALTRLLSGVGGP